MSMVMGFDGIDDYVNCGALATLDLQGAFTIEVLVKPRNFTDYQALTWKWDGPTRKGYIVYLLPSSGDTCQIVIYHENGGVRAFTSASYYVKKNTWTRITYTWSDVTDTIRLYIDSVYKEQQAGYDGLGIVALPCIIGATGTPTYPLNGVIAQVCFYNRVLSDDEIVYNIAHPQNPKRRGCVLNLTQESLFGGQWKDLSGNANHGTLANHAGPIPSNNLAGRQVSL